MTTSPTQGEHAQPKGTASDGKTELFNVPGYPLMVRAVDFNRLHAENERLAALVEAQPDAHVQNPAGIEHVAGDVSKNGAESNMAQRPAPSAAAALPEGWVPLVITHEGQYPEEVAYGPQILMDRLGKWLRKYFDHVVASKGQPAPTPQADSQPAPVLDERAAFAEHWQKNDGRPPITWEALFAQQGTETPTHCAGRYFLRETQTAWEAWQARAARAPADSVTAPATESYVQPVPDKCDRIVWRGNYYHLPPSQAADSVLEDAARLEALHAAVTAIYLDDSSDFKSALGAVVRHLEPKLAGDLLAWPKRAFDISQARLDAARKQEANHDHT